MADLTPRQKEIVDLQKQGKKAKEIADALSISENAVYQHLRRIRESAGKPKPSASAPKGLKSGRQSSAKGEAPAPVFSPEPPQRVSRPLTPLQAVRARRTEVEAGLKDAEAGVVVAQRSLDAAKEKRDKVLEKVGPELAGLDAAEAALKGELSLPEAAIQVGQAVAAATPTPAAPVEPTPEPAPVEDVKVAAKAGADKPKGKQSGKPSTQQQREASQDEFDEAEAEAAQAAAETPAPVAS